MPERGVSYVAYGSAAVAAARCSIKSLRQFHSWPVAVVTNAPETFRDCIAIRYGEPGAGARRAKLNLDNLLPAEWQSFLYLDADTIVHGDLGAGFDVLADGWDLAITASEHQEIGWLWHAGEAERALTLEECGRALQLQGGVWYAARNERTAALFAAWRAEWERFGAIDQGALLRALERTPVKLWLLGHDYNGGELVEHLFGKARA
jgi:hypothetical protein